MYRHELRFVLRFGASGKFHALAAELYDEETARGWTEPRVWQSVSGRVNEIVIEHDYEDADAFRAERNSFHADPGRVGALLAQIADLAVPGTAAQFDLDGIVPTASA